MEQGRAQICPTEESQAGADLLALHHHTEPLGKVSRRELADLLAWPVRFRLY
jgi:hypothetical protein